ncbi:FAD binding domain-containing protein [Lignipirellula cremea]|uniref:4-hydroxybenzoyl-CoA reductase subunit beta n=1 Tax=Lignipirellula cremea TaxID=2528010 RepID=A0A518DTC0_9BACT|nr:FAD binding domain-containing protein [Lignipirellula cremea]QDU95087.1 4-hydroxybenzoyl-CoA reductase subunit beta [Lignipirellula cremea]
MKNFEYAHPRTEAEALALLSPRSGRAEVLAGGTDLVGLMKRMVVSPDRVVNVSDIDSMRQIQRGPNGELAIGASTNLEDLLDSSLVDPFPSIKQVLQNISSIQQRSQSTVGGELCRRPQCWYFRNGHGLLAGDQVAQGDNRYHAIFDNQGPARFVNASRLAPALISLGAQIRVIGPDRDAEAILPLADLYRTPRTGNQRESSLESGQLITHLLLPAAGMRLSAAYEVRHGQGPDAPLAAAAVSLETSLGVVRSARIVLGQVAPTPWISAEAEQCLLGRPLTAETAAEAGQAAVCRATPLKDNHYKIQLASVSVKRAIMLAAGIEFGGL